VNNAALSLCAGAQNQVAPGAANQLNIPEHVRQLQEDLRTLGFLIVGTPSGDFDLRTEWAVREFQAYSKMQNVAVIRQAAPANTHQGAHLVAALGQLAGSNPPVSVYVDSLEGTANNAAYTGAVSGIVNADTRTALEHWLQHEWRCPVIIEAWRVQNGNRATLFTQTGGAPAVNVWLHDEVASSAPRFFARDFSGYYTFPTGRVATEYQVIGDFQTYLNWSGPRSVPPNHTWTEGEMLPTAIFGNATLSASQTSTYKAVRAVAEVECMGFSDSVNCYDNAFVSLGPCHWTLGIVNGNAVAEGELPGYLSYLRHADRAAFDTAIGFFGMRADEDWVHNGVGDGSSLFSSGSAKYSGWVALENASGGHTRLPLQEAEGNLFKTWHWHHRFVMAGRTVNGYRARMYHMARMRIRDIRRRPWGTGVANVGSGATSRPATIGDVFTSERAWALILRWHVRFPAHMVAGGGPGTRLRNALNNAITATAAANTPAGQTPLTWNGDPSTWTDRHEEALVNGIMAEVANLANGGLSQTMSYVESWPNWTGPGASNPRHYQLTAPLARLAITRNSLDFDTGGLPPAPP
jgi:peptidoglycan hydrolase-like protein with peptidoglycan-binding domain